MFVTEKVVCLRTVRAKLCGTYKRKILIIEIKSGNQTFKSSRKRTEHSQKLEDNKI